MKTVDRWKFVLAGSASVLAMVAGGAAAAQTPVTSPATARATQPVQAGQEGQAGQVGPAGAGDAVSEVIVTASRRSESIQNVPSEVSAVSGADLKKFNARGLEEFAGFVPGLSLQETNPGVTLIAVRGVTTGSQASNAVGLYLDDVPLGSSSSFAGGYQALSINTFDLSRVEVLDGPQGTLYGANSLGGAIKYVTAAPDPTRYGGALEAEGSFTDHGGTNHGFRALLNAPIVQDRVALRVDAFDQYDTGYAQDPNHGRDDQGSGRQTGFRASLLAEITPKLDVHLNVFDQQVRVEGVNLVERDGADHTDARGEFYQNFPLQQSFFNQLRLASATINYDLGFAKLTSITSGQRTDIKSLNDISFAYSALLGAVLGPAAVTSYANPTTLSTTKVTQEVRLTSPTNHHFEWTAGVFYTSEDSASQTSILNGADPRGYIFGAFPIFSASIPTHYEEESVFADGTYYFAPRLDLTFGIRYSHNDQSFTQSSFGLFNNAAAPFTPSVTPNGSSESVVTYLINPRFRINDNTQVYFRAASGYRPGGPNYVLSQGTGGPSFGADTLWTYELGAKTSLLNRKLTLDGAIYDSEWSDIQLSVIENGVTQLKNAGDARIRGVDFASTYQTPLTGLSLFGQFTYTDAYLTTTAPGLGVTYEGARLPVSPKYAFSLGGTYEFKLPQGNAGRFTLTDRYTGARTSGYAGSAISPVYRLNDYSLVDADLTVILRNHLELSVYARNIFDQRGEIAASAANQVYVPTAPALVSLVRPVTVGVEARAHF